MARSRQAQPQRRTVIKGEFPSTQKVKETLKSLGIPYPVIKVFVDERLPEGEKVYRVLRQSGLDYMTAPSSGTVEITVGGLRYVGLRDIKKIINCIKRFHKSK